MAIFANFDYKKMGLKIVEMASNFTCSCSYLFKDIQGLGGKFDNIFQKRVPLTEMLVDGWVGDIGTKAAINTLDLYFRCSQYIHERKCISIDSVNF